MASLIAKFVSKKILGETIANNFGKEDPYFETVPATRLDGRPSSTKTKRRRKALPPGISEHDAKVLTKVKRRAYRLDMSLFSCCGVRFGWSSVIGFVPAIGDVLDAFMAMMVLRTCQQVEGGLPTEIKAKMMFNIIVDFGIGLVPFLGDLADALFRANTRNAVVLEQHLRDKGAKILKAQGHGVPLDPTDPEVFDEQEEHSPPRYASAPPTRQNTQNRAHDGQSSRPKPTSVAVPEQARGGWFNKGKSKQPDIERGDRVGRETPSRTQEPRRNPSTLQKSRK